MATTKLDQLTERYIQEALAIAKAYQPQTPDYNKRRQVRQSAHLEHQTTKVAQDLLRMHQKARRLLDGRKLAS